MISSGSPHVLRAHMGVYCTCGEPDEIELTAMGVKLNGSRCRHHGDEHHAAVLPRLPLHHHPWQRYPAGAAHEAHRGRSRLHVGVPARGARRLPNRHADGAAAAASRGRRGPPATVAPRSPQRPLCTPARVAQGLSLCPRALRLHAVVVHASPSASPRAPPTHHDSSLS